MKSKIVFLSLVASVIFSAQMAMAYPGFSEPPVSGSELKTPTGEESNSVLGVLQNIKKLQLELKDGEELRTIDINLIEGDIFEADGPTPQNLLVANDGNYSSLFLMGPILVSSVKKVSADRLHIVGFGGSSYQCQVGREFDIQVIAAKKDSGARFSFRYLNVKDTKTGERCDSYN